MLISKASPQNNSDYRFLFQSWALTCFMSNQLQNYCIKTHLTFITHFPDIIFVLNIIEIVLFLCYHIRIETDPFQLKFTFKGVEKIIIPMNMEFQVENETLIVEDEAHH
ncbi:hypothetical protein RF11_03636 [Thelohanellus kitauei]|uniref:Uncharacterized protein n=1 Tax=Thelohanellus kitauei TaxID=669202 RepID=A0A0C2IBK4_THEKT|nr:hypothetical protein RF11_03636 [Thelohanellus kitauei]